MSFISKQRLLTILFLVVLIPVGFLTKFYSGPSHHWINNSLGGLFYEIFWCLVLYLFFPKLKPVLLAGIVFLLTCMLEFLQLWQPSFLQYLRSNFIGRTVLGNSFNWMDFPYYFAGSILGFYLLSFISTIKKK